MPHNSDRPLIDYGVLLAVITTLAWSGNAIAGKFAVGNVSPLMLTLCRWLFAATLVGLFGWRHLRNDWPEIRKNIGFLFAAGVFGFTVFNGLLYTSLKFTSAINVTILQSTMPMMIFALNFLVYGMRVHWAQVVGYTVTLVGVLLIAGDGSMANLLELSFNIGDVLILLAVFVYAAYSVALHAKPKLHWMSLLAMLSLFALVASIPAAAAEYIAGETIMPTTFTAWAVVLYTAIFPSIISQAAWIRCNELLGGNMASMFLNLVPIFGAALAVMILGEAFETYHALALTMVVGGIAIAQRLSRL
ncbi:MAG: DMT family transporter [Hyphomicrobiaceae bacterium]